MDELEQPEPDYYPNERWWELPRMPYRPQHLQIMAVLHELQPSGTMRHAELRAVMPELN